MTNTNPRQSSSRVAALEPLREQIDAFGREVRKVRSAIDGAAGDSALVAKPVALQDPKLWLEQLQRRMDSFAARLDCGTDRERVAEAFNPLRSAVGTALAELDALESEVVASNISVPSELEGFEAGLRQRFHDFEWAVFGKLRGLPEDETVDGRCYNYANGTVEIAGGDAFLGLDAALTPSDKLVEEARKACDLVRPGSEPVLARVRESWNMSDGAPCYLCAFTCAVAAG